MSFTAKQVEDALRVAAEGGNGWYSDPFQGLAYEDSDIESVEINGVGYPVEVVETDPGGEGHGESVYVIVKVGDQTFKKEGYYASHYGTDWDGDFFEVESREITVTKFVRK